MKWSVDNDDCMAITPCRLYDATGKEIEGGITACDTETGECLIQRKNEDGSYVIDYEIGEIVKDKVVFPAPLTIVPDYDLGKAILKQMLESECDKPIIAGVL
jgi:hypothetical protein